MAADIDSLSVQLASDARITTRTLWRILKDIDEEIYEGSAAGNFVPAAIRNVREVFARAYSARLDGDRAAAAGIAMETD